MKKGSIKNTRINAEVRKEIQSIIMNGLKDPRVSPMTTVTDARVTADLRYCTVYVSVYGGPEAEEQTLEGLKKASGYIRSELARTVNLRITPELRFAADRSMAYGAHIDSVLDELKKAENWDQDGETEQNGESDEQDTAE
ncbi:MAG: 30S ribosome-binding factor RbfA [Stomatobaculum sp.]|nr:30S ribosome-binding factor RbfA [Stomatobaculum sp.]